mgnify:CR=1 FL=1
MVGAVTGEEAMKTPLNRWRWWPQHLAMIMNTRQDVIDLLSKVLTGEMTPEAALDSWPSEGKTDDKLLRNAWHTLCHYANDDDIRAKDQSYAVRQRQTIEEIVTALKHSLVK